MNNTSGAIVLACSLGIWAAGKATGQETRSFSVHRNCGACVVGLKQIATITDRRSPGVPGSWAIVASGPERQFLVVNTADRSKIVVFDSIGAYKREVGTPGRGPGEFLAVVQTFTDPADTVYAVDYGNRRISVLRPDLSFVRDVDLPPGQLVFEHAGTGGFFATGPILTTNEAGYPIHRIDSRGRVVRSFGLGASTLDARRPAYLRWAIAPTRDGRLWGVQRFNFRVVEFDTTGTVLANYAEVVVPWVNGDGDPVDPLLERPPGTITAAAVDGRYLWIVAQVADDNWKPIPKREAEQAITAAETRKLYDTMIVAVDAVEGAIAGTLRSDLPLWLVSNSHYLYSYALAEDGYVVITVFEPIAPRRSD
jgi:6-bladed beta-propeller